MAGLPLRPLPALAQGVESKAAAERIVGSPVTEEQASSAADAAKVAAAIDNTGAAIEAVRKASKLDRVDIVFLPDAAATEGGPAPALDRKVKEHAGELSTLRDELAGNAMLYHAINSRRILAPRRAGGRIPRSEPGDHLRRGEAGRSQRGPLELPHHFGLEAIDLARTPQRHEGDVPPLPRLEANRSAGGNVEPHSPGFLAIEAKRRVGLEKVVMAADLDRPIAGAGDLQRHSLRALVELDLSITGDDLAWNQREISLDRAMSQRIGWWTVTSLVPSGKVAST